MPSDLRERIVGVVDTAAPPIDIDSLAQQLAASGQHDAARGASIPPMRRRVWAFAGALVGVLLVVGGALVAGVWLRDPESPVWNGHRDTTTATESVTSGLWLVALAVVVMSLGAAAFLASRRSNDRLTRGEEDAMQTLERTQDTTNREVEKLTTQRRWLIATLAFVLVVGAAAIGWLIAENRSLSSDLDSAENLAVDAQRAAEAESTIWPAAAELTAREKSMVDVTERFWVAWNEEDFDTIMGLYAPTAVRGGFSGTESTPVDGEYRSVVEGFREMIGEYELVQALVVGSFVIHVTETGYGQLDAYAFRFGPGTEPLIVSSYHTASTAAGPYAG